MRLVNKRCLIVGGTSGLGLAAARRFLEEGARLVVAGLEEEQNRLAVQELTPLGLTTCFTCDVTQPDRVEQLFQLTRQALGGLDVLYHVAGASGRRHGDGPLHQCSNEGWQWTLQANLTSAFLTNRAALGIFLAQGQGGVILNLGSVLACDPSPRYFDTVAYAAAKGGLIAMSLQAAARYAGEGIRINVLAPGLMDTPMSQRAVQEAEIRYFLQSKQPLAQGPGAAADCAGAAVFLCSDEARLITGVILPVDAGWSLSDGQYGQPGKAAVK